MKVTQILATNPGCGKTHVLTNLFLRDPHKCKYYLVPQNKQVIEIKSKLEALGVVNPKVQTIRSFLKNFRRLEYNSSTTYLPNNLVSKRAATKRVIDVFVDEASMISKIDINILINNFKIRNLFLAGDSNQFLPIAQKYAISEIGSTKDFEVYEDKGELFDYPYDTTFLLTKSMRAEDSCLKQWIERIKYKLSIYPIIEYLLTKKDLSDKYQHIAYTNKMCDEINAAISNNEVKQYIIKNSDKVFGLLKGQKFTSDNYQFRSKCASKKSYFIEQEKLGKLTTTAEEAYDDWFNYTFGYAYAVTCHKLQGSTIKDKPIMIHLSDIMKCIEAHKDNPAEYKKWIDNFHRFIYIAVSRVTNSDNVYFSGDEYVAKNLSNLRKYCKDIKAFKDNYDNNIIETDSENFNYDEICYYSEDEITEIEYAKKHSYKEYKQIYNKCENKFLSLRKTEVPQFTSIKETKIGTLDNDNTSKDNYLPYSSVYIDSLSVSDDSNNRIRSIDELTDEEEQQIADSLAARLYDDI